MKTILTFATCLLVATQVFSQTAKTVSKTTTTTHKASVGGGSTISAEKSALLCKAWKLDSVEQFGVAQAASAKEKTDIITFMADGTFFITSEGVAGTGTWKGNAVPYINTSVGTPEIKKMYKVLSLADSRLVIEYQTEDLIRIKYTYSPKK
jgi:hypothetical protein